jgi:hypothetical protein
MKINVRLNKLFFAASLLLCVFRFSVGMEPGSEAKTSPLSVIQQSVSNDSMIIEEAKSMQHWNALDAKINVIEAIIKNESTINFKNFNELMWDLYTSLVESNLSCSIEFDKDSSQEIQQFVLWIPCPNESIDEVVTLTFPLSDTMLKNVASLVYFAAHLGNCELTQYILDYVFDNAVTLLGAVQFDQEQKKQVLVSLCDPFDRYVFTIVRDHAYGRVNYLKENMSSLSRTSIIQLNDEINSFYTLAGNAEVAFAFIPGMAYEAEKKRLYEQERVSRVRAPEVKIDQTCKRKK